ncbi:MAG: ribosome assembly RNA-binding protein YhbY [Gammaproteobacteria bacterium]
MSLTESQCKHLRGRGHDLKTVVLVGSGGLTDRVLAEINSTLERHELIKVRIRSGDREARDALIREVVSGSAAALVQRIGNVAFLYRAAEKPTIVLPP